MSLTLLACSHVVYVCVIKVQLSELSPPTVVAGGVSTQLTNFDIVLSSADVHAVVSLDAQALALSSLGAMLGCIAHFETNAVTKEPRLVLTREQNALGDSPQAGTANRRATSGMRIPVYRAGEANGAKMRASGSGRATTNDLKSLSADRLSASRAAREATEVTDASEFIVL